MKAIGFAGYSGSGKTTLIERLLPLFRADALDRRGILDMHCWMDQHGVTPVGSLTGGRSIRA